MEEPTRFYGTSPKSAVEPVYLTGRRGRQLAIMTLESGVTGLHKISQGQVWSKFGLNQREQIPPETRGNGRVHRTRNVHNKISLRQTPMRHRKDHWTDCIKKSRELENIQVHRRMWAAFKVKTKGDTMSPRNGEQLARELYPKKTLINRLIMTSKGQSR